MAEPDRVSVTLGMKFPGPEEYSSVHWSVTIARDVKKSETIEDAYQSVLEIVEAKNEGLHHDYGSLFKSGEEEDEEEDEEEIDED